MLLTRERYSVCPCQKEKNVKFGILNSTNRKKYNIKMFNKIKG